jgi:protein TonB
MAGLMSVGAVWVFNNGMISKFVPSLEKKMEVLILQQEKPQEVIPPPEVKKVKVDVPPPPELTAPPIEFVPPEPPVITAPPAPVEPAPVIIAAPTPPAPPAPAVPDTKPRLLTREKPDYPAAAIRAQEQGDTKLDICVTAQGRVQSVNVVGSSGSPRLDEAAAKWMRGAKFSPAVAGGQATAMCGYSITYAWNLENAKRG